MKKTTYSFTNIIKCKFINIYTNVFTDNKNNILKKYKDYSLVKLLNPEKLDTTNNISGLYMNTKGEKVVLKYSSTTMTTYDVLSLINDYYLSEFILRKINSLKSECKFSIPRNIEFNVATNKVVLIREYISGNSISNFNSQIKINLYNNYLDFMELITNYITKSKKLRIAIKSDFYIFCLSFYYLTKILFKCPRIIYQHIDAIYIMYNYFLRYFFTNKKYTLAHRDLHFGNMLSYQDKTYILDFESCVLAEELTDLAISSRYFIDEFNFSDLTSLIGNNLTTKKKRKIFIKLSLFYTFQMFSLENPDSMYFEQAEKYLNYIQNNFIVKQKNKSIAYNGRGYKNI